ADQEEAARHGPPQGEAALQGVALALHVRQEDQAPPQEGREDEEAAPDRLAPGQLRAAQELEEAHPRHQEVATEGSTGTGRPRLTGSRTRFILMWRTARGEPPLWPCRPPSPWTASGSRSSSSTRSACSTSARADRARCSSARTRCSAPASRRRTSSATPGRSTSSAASARRSGTSTATRCGTSTTVS